MILGRHNKEMRGIHAKGVSADVVNVVFVSVGNLQASQ